MLKHVALSSLVVFSACADSNGPVSRLGSHQLRQDLHVVGATTRVYHLDEKFRETNRTLVQGTRNPDGDCAYTRTVTLSPGAHLTEAVAEVSFDNCQYIMVQGEYDHPATDTAGRARDTIAVADDNSSEFARNRQTATQLLTGYSATLDAWIEDPVALRVNGVKELLTWYNSGSSVYGGSANTTYDWLTGSGWMRTAWAPGTLTNSGSKYVYSTNTLYTNPYFCVGFTTLADYPGLKIEGIFNGTATFTWSGVNTSGGCSGLLTIFHSATVS